MLKASCRATAIGAVLLLTAQAAISANAWLTEKQFQNRDAGEFVGTIVSVQITTSTRSAESGAVQFRVNQVIAGTITSPTVTFPFERAMEPPDSPSNWDVIQPLGLSLKTNIGNEFLVYFTESKGVYSLYPAGNSVQAIGQGLLVGTIESVHKNHWNPEWSREDSSDVEIQVSETVYGWVKGTKVTLPYAKVPSIGSGEARSGASYALAGAIPGTADAGQNLDSFVTPEMLDEKYRNANQGKQYIVAFANGRITGLMIASKTFLETLQTLDSE
jgi:hypothetical protein